MLCDYRNIKSLHPVLEQISFEEKLMELKNNPEFLYLVDRIYSRLLKNNSIPKLIE